MAVKHSQQKAKNKKGAAANYITRTQAVKKLQCSLADFRRLCILKGIFPREPRNRKKANSGSTAPTTFFYTKDIQYLLHEPVLDTLRQHKTFAKKLSKAVGRREWSLAKNLEESKPSYHLDHIIKERYPTFDDAVRDLDDALSLIFLFSRLPASESVQASVIEHCGRLAAQWQLYVLRTNSLRKVFLSIKGIYFQAEIRGQPVTWLVPYQFTQQVPSDVDFRIMLTFIELYQTLLGFVFYKLYSDINLVYPPKLETSMDDEGYELGALILEEASRTLTLPVEQEQNENKNKDKDSNDKNSNITARQVKQQIKSIVKSQNEGSLDSTTEQEEEEEEKSSSKNDNNNDQVEQEEEDKDPNLLFSNYVFYLSREVTRPTLEFVIRSFGGKVGWDPTLGGGSPYTIDDERITHFVIDRPIDLNNKEKASSFRLPSSTKCAFIQPQWVIDCLNYKKLLPTDDYGPGKTLPPHLSPFVDVDEARRMGEYVPGEAVSRQGEQQHNDDDDDDDEDEMDEDDVEGDPNEPDQEEDEEDEGGSKARGGRPALNAAAKAPGDESLRHAAELEAEAKGITYAQFESELSKAAKAAKKSGSGSSSSQSKNDLNNNDKMAEMMLSGKQKKLYKKMAYSRDRKVEEKQKLEQKRKKLDKAKRQK